MKNLKTFHEFLNEAKINYDFAEVDQSQLKIKRNRGTYYPDDTDDKLDLTELKSLYTPKAVEKYANGMAKSEKIYASEEKRSLDSTLYNDFMQFTKLGNVPADVFSRIFIEFVQTCLRYNLQYFATLLMK